MALLTFAVLCIQFSVTTFIIDGRPWNSAYIQDYVGFVVLAIVVLVIAIPEGLPLAVMLSLAYAVTVSRFFLFNLKLPNCSRNANNNNLRVSCMKQVCSLFLIFGKTR